MASDIIQVVTTTADKHDADVLAQALLSRRLAGCIQVSGPIESTYWWNGRLETAREWVCTIKTLQELYGELETAILELHPYDQPELLATPTVGVSPGYARWLHEQLQGEPVIVAATEDEATSPDPKLAASSGPTPDDVTPPIDQQEGENAIAPAAKEPLPKEAPGKPTRRSSKRKGQASGPTS